MTPACHGEGATLVCLIQGLPYSWPVSVIWKRDGEVLSEAIATEHERARARAECDFVVASRLRLSATEWASSHEYTCLGRQGEVATKESSFRSTGQPVLDSFKVHLSLWAGQVVFLLLIAKSFVYGSILGIYTIYKKKGF
ncbi:Ig lambda-2 chain C region [Varanus komodoensis]|nr:Ig lambda-2 chain C region [Varanus komodoensis]